MKNHILTIICMITDKTPQNQREDKERVWAYVWQNLQWKGLWRSQFSSGATSLNRSDDENQWFVCQWALKCSFCMTFYPHPWLAKLQKSTIKWYISYTPTEACHHLLVWCSFSLLKKDLLLGFSDVKNRGTLRLNATFHIMHIGISNKACWVVESLFSHHIFLTSSFDYPQHAGSHGLVLWNFTRCYLSRHCSPWGRGILPCIDYRIQGWSAEQGMVFLAACHKHSIQFKSISYLFQNLLSYSGYLLFFQMKLVAICRQNVVRKQR